MSSDGWLPEKIEDVDLLSRQEVDDLLRVNLRTIDRLVKHGKLRAVKIPPGLVRFHRRDVADLVRRHTHRG